MSGFDGTCTLPKAVYIYVELSALKAQEWSEGVEAYAAMSGMVRTQEVD